MRTAQVVLDIQTQSLDSEYTYVVPEDMMGVSIGCAVLVEFGRRQAIGYVMELSEVDDEAPAAREDDLFVPGKMCFVDETCGAKPVSAGKTQLKPLLAVLSPSYFDEDGADLIRFISHTYIAPLASCVHLLTPTGRTPKVVKSGDDWQLQKPAKRRKPKASKKVADQAGADGAGAGNAFATDAASVAGAGDADNVDIATVSGAANAAGAVACAGDASITLSSSDALTPQQIAAFAAEHENFTLTDAQSTALDHVRTQMTQGGRVVVMDGVTGSGKTEVYLRAIRRTLEQGRTAIVLVPEIALTPQTVSRFKSRFGDTVAVLHSKMTGAERFDQWESIRNGESCVVVGARSALFCPLSNVGLIIIDEEHESTYKQESAPRYHARAVAEWMAARHGATLILGSATPSIEALCNSKAKPHWSRVVLSERANGAPMPEITIVDMAKEFGSGSRSMFSKGLTQAMFDALEAGRKVVLLLNQRGFANFLLCRECGFVPECPTCSVSLTYHEHGNQLVCHHCGKRVQAPVTCPECGSPYLKKFGAGTQRVEVELRALLPDARIIRMDSDTTATRNAHQKLLDEFAQPGPAVLLGTQMIAKGLDFDEVTLVGVINADTQLRLPDFRSAERTFDLIEQVAGRAGRGAFSGRVFVQTYMADAYAIKTAALYNRSAFLRDELSKRKVLFYPPYARLANILVWGANEGEVREVAQKLAVQVEKALFDVVGPGWQTHGAAPCALEKLRNQRRWHILVKAPMDADIAAVLAPIMRKRRAHKNVNVACDVDPNSLL